jgi:hypothetical protein
MSGATVDIQHLAEVQAKIKALGNGIQPALRSVSGQARRLLVQDLSAYPPERSDQTYQRTGELGRGWERATPLDQGQGFQLVNPSEHARWTQGDDQAWMHKGRWRTARQIAHEHTEEILALYEDALRELI